MVERKDEDVEKDQSSEEIVDSDANDPENNTDVISIIPSPPSLDLSAIPEERRGALVEDMARGVIAANTRAAEAAVDTEALRRNLGSLADVAREATEEGTAVTAHHTQKTSSGGTEVTIGNTDRAREGRLPKSLSGEQDWRPYYIIGGIVALALVGIAIANNI